MKQTFTKIAMLALLVIPFGVAIPAFAASEIVYDALPSVSPDTSYPSQPFQAQQTLEFGDSIHLGGTNRILSDVTVTMVTWAKFADYSTDPTYMSNPVDWTHPITLNIYGTSLDSNGVPDTLLATVTNDITVPWRPEASEICGTGLQWEDSLGNCNNGYAFNATFDMSGLNTTLPEDIIVSVAYNTQTYGLSPIGENGPYNSLNVAVPVSQPVTVGSDDNVDAIFWNSETYTGGIFKEDIGWTPYGTVALRVGATAPFVPPTDSNQCKKGGWENFTNPTFKNQGQCVSYVQSNEKAGKRN